MLNPKVWKRLKPKVRIRLIVFFVCAMAITAPLIHIGGHALFASLGLKDAQPINSQQNGAWFVVGFIAMGWAWLVLMSYVAVGVAVAIEVWEGRLSLPDAMVATFVRYPEQWFSDWASEPS
jgi:hypothetical protein